MVQIGFARAVITPPLPVALSGYGARVGIATEVHDDLEVRVMAVADGDHVMVLLSLDLMAMSRDWADAVRDAVAASLAIADRAAVLTTTVHTHAAPSTITGTDALGWVVPHEWRPTLVATCVDAAQRARAMVRPVTLKYSQREVPPTLAYNRRGFADRAMIAVLDVVDSVSGERVGTVVNAGVHPTVTGPKNLQVSSDYVGELRRRVEAAFGGIALFVQGAQGDINPVLGEQSLDPDTTFTAVAAVGAGFAALVGEMLADAEPVSGETGVHRSYLATVQADGSAMSAITRSASVHAELVEWRVGGMRIVTIPGEAFAKIGQAAFRSSTMPLMLAGFCPHWLGYLPDPFDASGYEESLSYGPPLVDVVREHLVFQ